MSDDTNPALGAWEALVEKETKGKGLADLSWETPEGIKGLERKLEED